MAVNKVVMNTENGEEVLVDLTGDTVTPETLAEGATAHSADGRMITGTMRGGGGEASFPTGTEGQILGYDSSGNVIAMDNEALIAAQQAAHSAIVAGEGALVVPLMEQYNRMFAGDIVESGDGLSWVHWSSKTPTKADFENGFAIQLSVPLEMEDTEFGFSGTECQVYEYVPKALIQSALPDAANMYDELVFDLGGALAVMEIFILVVQNDGWTIGEGVTFPKKGIWVMPTMGISALRINGYSFSEGEGAGKEEGGKLYPGSAEVVDNTLTWDGDTAGLELVSVLGLMNFYRVSSVVPIAEADPTRSGIVTYVRNENGEENTHNIPFVELTPIESFNGGLSPAGEDAEGLVLIFTKDTSVSLELGSTTLTYNFKPGVWFTQMAQNGISMLTTSLFLDGYIWPEESADNTEDTGGHMMVRITRNDDGSYSADKTYAEVLAALEAGNSVTARCVDAFEDIHYIPVTNFDPERSVITFYRNTISATSTVCALITFFVNFHSDNSIDARMGLGSLPITSYVEDAL